MLLRNDYDEEKLKEKQFIIKKLSEARSVAKPYECDICGARRQGTYGLKQHMKMHIKFQLYACDKCEFKTNYETAMKVHSDKHKNKTYCEICKKFVPTKMLHIKRYHNERKCKFCDEMVTRSTTPEHLKKFHNYRCSQCRVFFRTSPAFRTKEKLDQ